MRVEALERAGYCCEECGVQDCDVVVNPNKPHPLYPDGQPRMVHLAVAHKNEYQTWNRDAGTLVLCPGCHGRFDARNRRKDSGKERVPIGYVTVRVLHRGRWALSATPWSYNELFRAISALPVATEFELCFEIATQSVGLGRYRKGPRGVVALREKGVGRDFSFMLAGIPSYA
jgi:hypothetical protein